MEQYILYLVIKSLILSIDNSYTITFNDRNENGADTVAVYIRGGEVSMYRELSTGDYFNIGARVQILIQSDDTKSSLIKMLGLATKLKKGLVRTNNKEFQNIDGLTDLMSAPFDCQASNLILGISDVKLLGEVNFSGKNTQGKPKYDINFNFDYYIRTEE